MSEHNTQKEQELIDQERNQVVARSVSLIQNARYSLSLQEQRFLLYCISKVKPNDAVDTEYTIDLKDFLKVCGLHGSSSYDTIKNEIMATLLGMRFQFEEIHPNGDREFKAINWFSSLSVLYKKDKVYSSKVGFQFTQPVAKLLTGLAAYNENAAVKQRLYYISDELKYMLPFKCRYSHYLYPLLRSYQNRTEWTFSMEGENGLRELLDVYERESGKKTVQERITANNLRIDEEVDFYRRNLRRKRTGNISEVEELPHARKRLYPKFSDFRKHVLDPAVEDINTYSNIKVAYIPIKRGRTVTHISFLFEDKNLQDKIWSEQRGQLVLDRDEESNNIVWAVVRGVEKPLEFEKSHLAGAETIPGSVLVAPSGKKKNNINTMADIREHMKETEKYIQTRPEYVPDYGKHKEHKTDFNGRPLIDIEKIFCAIADSNKIKSWRILIDEDSLRQYSYEAKNGFSKWGKKPDAKEFGNFLIFASEQYGAKRLQEYLEKGKIRMHPEKNSFVIEVEGKTPIIDTERFLRRILADAELANEYLMEFYGKN